MCLNKSLEEKQMEALKRLVRDTDSAIIVEGIKDKKVLSSLGFKNIYSISGKSAEDVVKLIISDKPKSVSILTDFDGEGREYFKKLVKFFQPHDIKVDDFLRRKIKSITAIQKIEELAFFIKKLDGSAQFTFP